MATFSSDPGALPTRRRAHPRVLRTGADLAGWLALAVSLAVYLIISARVDHGPFYIGDRALRYFDLRVYRGAARRLLDAVDLYAHPIVHRLGFTYPPAAALVLAPLAWLTLAVDKVLVTAVNLLALVWLLHATLSLAGVRTRRAAGWSLAAGIAAAALWLEPVTTTIGYGQINLVIVALVVVDLARPAGCRTRGVGVGLAAGLKLTPLVFIPYLWLSGRRRAAAVASGTFAATIATSFAATGGDAARYWGGLVLDSSRVGGAGDAANQSLRGALSRLLAIPHPGAGCDLIVAAVTLLGLLIAAAASRRGREDVGIGLCGITTLLASPVSWTHHWVLALPGLVVLVVVAGRSGSPRLALGALAGAALGYAYLPERYMHGAPLTGLASLAADPYVLAGLAALALAGVGELRAWLQATVGPEGSGAPGTATTAGGGSSRLGAGGSIG